MASSAPLETTIRRLFALSLNRCAFPGCTAHIIEPATGTIVADVCHIRAQNKGGPRYDQSKSDEELHAIENLVLICRNHHKVIDDKRNLAEYTVERLTEIKLTHEAKAHESTEPIPDLSPAALAALKLTATTYQTGSVHMDFRDAQFQVGGGGGAWGGGGGAGGNLTIVGIAHLPPEITVNLNGQDGIAPGGGGGGAGAITFVGRSACAQDQENGFRISSFLPVNSVSVEKLAYMLGAGWSYLPVHDVPETVRPTFAFVVECGKLQAAELLRVTLTIANPVGVVVATAIADVEVPLDQCGVRRVFCFLTPEFAADCYGIWTANLVSGELELASIPFAIQNT